MGLIQTGSTLYRDGSSSGLTQLVYGCDGCEAKTGDLYAHIAFVTRPPGGEWDNSEVEGWAFTDDGDLCPECAAKAERSTS